MLASGFNIYMIPLSCCSHSPPVNHPTCLISLVLKEIRRKVVSLSTLVGVVNSRFEIKAQQTPNGTPSSHPHPTHFISNRGANGSRIPLGNSFKCLLETSVLQDALTVIIVMTLTCCHCRCFFILLHICHQLCFFSDNAVFFVSWNSTVEEKRSSKTAGHMTGVFCSSY